MIGSRSSSSSIPPISLGALTGSKSRRCVPSSIACDDHHDQGRPESNSHAPTRQHQRAGFERGQLPAEYMGYPVLINDSNRPYEAGGPLV
jgi:hypothetical protein